MIRSALAAYAIAAGVVEAVAQPSMCAAIRADVDRLACYDQATKTKQEAPAGATLAARAYYGDALRKTFLSSGMDFDVYWPETRPAGTVDQFNQYPRLIIFGHINNPLIYQLITDGQVLTGAKSAGFKMVQFFSKSGSGGWWYDLSGPEIPKCDVNKRLCR